MHPDITIAMSEVQDGSMSAGVSDEERLLNRRVFLEQYDMSVDRAVLVRLKYEGSDYRRYHTVDEPMAGDGIVRPSTIVADALFTKDFNLTLLLPIADCIAAVLYDPEHMVLGVSHLGRHNLVQHGGRSTIEYMATHFSSIPNDLKICLSPAAGKENYPLFDFDGMSLHEVALNQLLNAGVARENIDIDARDTTKDATLFSHSEFLKGNQNIDGRQAVVAMMR